MTDFNADNIETAPVALKQWIDPEIRELDGRRTASRDATGTDGGDIFFTHS